MHKKHLITAVVAIFLMGTIGIVGVSAQETNGTTSLNNRTQVRVRLKELQEGVDKNLTDEQRLTRLDEFKRLAAFERCQLRERNFSARMEYYQLMRDRQSQIYNRLLQNLQKGIERLKSLKEDTKNLEAELANLQGQVDKVRSTYFDAQEAMQKVAAQICDLRTRDQVDVKNLEKLMESLRTQEANIRKFLKDSILTKLTKTTSTSTATSST